MKSHFTPLSIADIKKKSEKGYFKFLNNLINVSNYCLNINNFQAKLIISKNFCVDHFIKYGKNVINTSIFNKMYFFIKIYKYKKKDFPDYC